MVSYLNTKTSLIFLIMIPHMTSLTPEQRHLLSSMFGPNISFCCPHCIYVAFLHQIHNHNLQCYQKTFLKCFDIFNIWQCRPQIMFPLIFWKVFCHTWSFLLNHLFIFIISNSPICIVAKFLFKFLSGNFWLLYKFQTSYIISSLPFVITYTLIICLYLILTLSYLVYEIIAVFLTITLS